MLFVRVTLTTTAFAGLLVSQTNPYVFYPQDPERQTITCTSYVGRPDLANAAEALLELDPRHVRGVGDANGLVRYFGVYHWVADERLSTSESYGLVVRKSVPAGGPDMTPAGAIFSVGPLSTPPSTSTARGTWIMHDGFNIQGGFLFNLGSGWAEQPTHYVGVSLPANPLWPATDGHSLFRADLLSANTPATVGENHRAGAHNPTWAGRIGQPSFSTPWTYILGPYVTSPNLHLGGTDPTSTRLGAPGANLSMNGLYPDIGGNPRRDGLLVRVTDNLAPSGWVFGGLSLGFQPAYYSWGMGVHLIGMSYIGDESGNPPITLPYGLLQNGVRETILALPGTIPVALLGTEAAVQAVVFDGNSQLGEWTNAEAIHF